MAWGCHRSVYFPFHFAFFPFPSRLPLARNPFTTNLSPGHLSFPNSIHILILLNHFFSFHLRTFSFIFFREALGQGQRKWKSAKESRKLEEVMKGVFSSENECEREKCPGKKNE